MQQQKSIFLCHSPFFSPPTCKIIFCHNFFNLSTLNYHHVAEFIKTPHLTFSSFSFLGFPLSTSILNICFAAFLVHKQLLSKWALCSVKLRRTVLRGGKVSCSSFALSLLSPTRQNERKKTPVYKEFTGVEEECVCAERELKVIDTLTERKQLAKKKSRV